ncbi:MAG: cation:proton antiporter [Dehalococcoidia bacterium]|nr:cation:proton antiporter [Dehalococcoidia bacterium]
MDQLLALGLILVVGLAGGLLSKRLKLPSITGYILVGIALGPTVSGVIPVEVVDGLSGITGIALGVIAFLIGGSLQRGTLRSLGRSIGWITVFESVGAFVAVAVSLSLLGAFVLPGYNLVTTYIPFALMMAAISSATAPAAVMAIVREYRAKGPLTSTLLAVVALDDAVGVILFACAVGAAQILIGASGTGILQVLSPLFDILLAIVVGGGCAVLLLGMQRFVRSREVMLALVLGVVVLCAGLSRLTGASEIIANMTVGIIVANRHEGASLMSSLEDVETSLYTMFFVLAGLQFDLSVLRTAGLIAVIIVVVRSLGKYGGVRLGARIGHAPEGVGSYLGFALLPQAGVSIGLTLVASQIFPDMAGPMVSATLASVIINELITPPLARYALMGTGEARFSAPKDEPPMGDGGATSSPQIEVQPNKSDLHTASLTSAARPNDPHLLEGPWVRSQRARSRANDSRRK